MRRWSSWVLLRFPKRGLIDRFLIVTKKLDFTDFSANRQIFKYLSKILGNCDFHGFFMLNMKGYQYVNIDWKFQVHSCNIFGLGAKKYHQVVTTTLPLTLTVYTANPKVRVFFFFFYFFFLCCWYNWKGWSCL